MHPLTAANLFFYCISVVFSSPIAEFEQRPNLDVLNFEQNVRLDMDETGQCMHVKSEEGTYIVDSVGTQQVCGLYVITDPDKKVEFTFRSFDISCVKGGLLSVIDGWELNGQFFPNPNDSPAKKTYVEYCGGINKPRKSMISSQNVALIEYRIPTKGQGFVVSVRFIDNPKPCNVVLQEPQGRYTIRNYNRKVNCSVSVIFPLRVQVVSASIGVHSRWPLQTLQLESGLMSKCRKRHMNDYLEIRGGDGLDPLEMNVAADYCGRDSYPNRRAVTVACGNTAVRLVSSGHFENSVTFEFDLPMDFEHLDLLCESFGAALASL